MSVISIAIALGVSGLVGLISWKVHSSLRKLQRNLAIEAFFDPAISSVQAISIAHREITGIPGIASYTFISKEQALEDYKTSSGEDVESVLGVNPLPASIKVYLVDPT